MRKLLINIFLIFPISIYSQTFTGRIIQIIDGDAFLFQTDDSTFAVHMYGIDAPDIGQTFVDQTIAHMESYLWNDAEIMLKKDINQEGISAILFIDGTNINKELVKNGYAWYNKLHTNDAELARAEMHARENKLGLWISDSPTPPWDFRNGILAKPPPTDGEHNVLICTNPKKDDYYHKGYCKELLRCHSNVIVISREQAKELQMKPCKYCYKKNSRKKK
ncbi:MAG: thermonuclease family protein [Bacteroidales bacterium]|nr:thermonuclease family protein [Bacteroidales bacterium]